MCDPLNNPPINVRIRAQREILLMSLIQDEPMTLKQLAAAMNINPRTVKSMVYDLRKAGVVHRKLGTHLLFLVSDEFFHIEPDFDSAWMQT